MTLTFNLFSDFSFSFIDQSLHSLYRHVLSTFSSSTNSISKCHLSIEYQIKAIENNSVDNIDLVRGSVAHTKSSVYLIDTNGNLCSFPEFLGPQKVQPVIYISPQFNPSFFTILIDYLVHRFAVFSGAFLCHSSSFIYKDQFFIFPAWRNVGKTNLLIAALSLGAKFFADDWTLLYKDGSKQLYPKNMNLEHYNIPFFNKYLSSTASSSNLSYLSQPKTLEYFYNSLFNKYSSEFNSMISCKIPYSQFLLTESLDSSTTSIFSWLSPTKSNPVPTLEQLEASSICNHILATLKNEQYPFRLCESLHAFKICTYNETLQRMTSLEQSSVVSSISFANKVQKVNVQRQSNPFEILNILRLQ